MSTDSEPCEGALDHRPQVWWTQRHHVYPKYLCSLLGVPTRHLLIPLCANCHERVHHALKHLINTGTQVHRLSAGEQACTTEAWEWWQHTLLGE